MISLEDAARIHGHKGPFLVIGYRAGARALEELKPGNEHDLVAILYIPSTTPYTCIADGVQFATGCTFGKGNIAVINSKEIKLVFEKQSTGERMVFVVNKSFIRKIESLSMKEAAELAEKAEWGEIFCRIEKQP